MLKILTAAVVSMFSLCQFSLAAVNFDNPGSDFKGVLNDILVPMPVPVPAAPAGTQINSAKEVKEWTVMVYLNGKNNLEDCGLIDVNEMEMIGSSDKVNVVLELGRISGYDSTNGDWKGVRRYLIRKDTDTAHVTSPVVQDLGASDMGDYKSILAFGQWAKSAYPAKKYMLIIWNHGSGWIDTKSRKGISYDDETGHNLNTPQMAMALKGMGGVDLYASDACLMQMAEVLAEIKDDVPFVVGSEETMEVDGFTYDTLLGSLVKDPYMDAERLGRLVVDSVTDHYAGIRKGSTQSLIKSAAIPGFITAVNGFADALVALNDRELVRKAKGDTQRFSEWDNRDLYHFVKLVTDAATDAALKEKGAALMQSIKGDLVLYNRTVNSVSIWGAMANYDNAYGVAVYLPTRPAASYANLVWARQSTWDEMLTWMTQP